MINVNKNDKGFKIKMQNKEFSRKEKSKYI